MPLARKKPFSSFSSFRRKKNSFGKSGFGQTPKNTGRYIFTMHSEYKMREYHLSRQRIIRVIRSPKRTETGIVENTVAVMQPSSTRRVDGKEVWAQEIWVMYKISQKPKANNGKLETLLAQPQLKIISTWRYPGISPERDPIPEEILREIQEFQD